MSVRYGIKQEEIHSTLVKQLTNGSKDAFTKLYMLYSDQLYGFALKLTKSPTEAEDILQETFMRIWLNQKNISLESSFKSYLFQISYHLVIDSFRKKINMVDFESFIRSTSYQIADTNEADIQLTLDDYQKLIKQSVSHLTPRQQLIFHLSREKYLSSLQIAEKLGISEKTVNNQLSLILATLKADILLFIYFMLFNS